jgi:hypothetical protein
MTTRVAAFFPGELRAEHWLRWRSWLLRRTSAVAWALLSAAALATPYVADKTLGPVGFAKGSTVTVYIAKDPMASDPDVPQDRVPAAQAGALQWAEPLKAIANVDLKVVKLDAAGNDPATGKAPDYSQPGAVKVSWDTHQQFVAAGQGDASAYATHANQTSDPAPGGKGGPRVNARLTTGGEIHLAAEGLGVPQAGMDYATRAAIHELGHVLGLTHTKVAAAMNGDLMFQPFPGEVTTADKVELGAVYGLTEAQVKATIKKSESAAGTSYDYRYRFDYLGGYESALFQIALDSATDVYDVLAPPGWVFFFSEARPGETDAIEAPVDGLTAGTVLTFRADLLDGAEPYLGPLHPSFEFGFSSLLPESDGLAWAASLETLAVPRSVPEPSSLWLVVAALGAAGWTPSRHLPGRQRPLTRLVVSSARRPTDRA